MNLIIIFNLRMLFKQLYNWIKYKTLPSSILFKNRLFIERNSKHKRIFNNLGLTFRNSKWNNYEILNINISFKKKYFKLVFFFSLFVIFFFIIFNFNNYYVCSYIYNNVYYIFWIGIDTIDYYVSFFLWLLAIILSMITNYLYSFFFLNNFLKPNSNSDDNLLNFFKTNNNINSKITTNDYFLSKKDYKWVLYSWLNKSNSSNSFKINILENVFNNKINYEIWNNYYDFFIKLYKVTYYFNLSDEKNSIYYLNNKLNKLLNDNFEKNNLINFSFFTKYSNITMWIFLNNYKNYFDNTINLKTKTLLKNSRYDFNINSIINKNHFILKNKNNCFYFLNYNQNDIYSLLLKFNEFFPINYYISNQSNIVRWDRWLYKYSILHRKLLKNSHKLILSKKLLNTETTDLNLISKDLWIFNFLNKNLNNNVLNNFNNFFYQKLNQNQKINLIFNYNEINLINNFNFKNNLNFLKIYETSYFWFLKRFYMFNSLQTVSMFSNLKSKTNFNKKNQFISEKNTQFNIFKLFYSFLLKSFNFNLNEFYYFNEFIPTSYNFYNKFKNNDFFSKDIYILQNDLDLINKDNLIKLFWITTSSYSDSNYKINALYNNYLNFTTIENNLNTCLFNHNDYNLNLINDNMMNYFILNSFENFDNIYLNDLIFFFKNFK